MNLRGNNFRNVPYYRENKTKTKVTITVKTCQNNSVIFSKNPHCLLIIHDGSGEHIYRMCYRRSIDLFYYLLQLLCIFIQNPEIHKILILLRKNAIPKLNNFRLRVVTSIGRGGFIVFSSFLLFSHLKQKLTFNRIN